MIISTLLIGSCAPLRLTGEYPDTHFSKETDLSYEEVWVRVIDYFAIAGIPISTIDKASGLIVSSKVSFVNNYTREVHGKPQNEKAYVVIPTVRGGFGNILEPRAALTGDWEMFGDWNVRIKNSNNKTMVSVNMLNLYCFYRVTGIIGSTTQIPIKSTGVFEQSLLNYLTQ